MDSHAWTDESGSQWVAVKGGALRPLEVPASRVPSKAVGDEILRLAEELRMENLAVATLREEVERLRADREALAENYRELEVTAFTAWEHGTKVAERAKIRGALLSEIPVEAPSYLDNEYNKGWNAAARMAREALDRVLPES